MSYYDDDSGSSRTGHVLVDLRVSGHSLVLRSVTVRSTTAGHDSWPFHTYCTSTCISYSHGEIECLGDNAKLRDTRYMSTYGTHATNYRLGVCAHACCCVRAPCKHTHTCTQIERDRRRYRETDGCCRCFCTRCESVTLIPADLINIRRKNSNQQSASDARLQYTESPLRWWNLYVIYLSRSVIADDFEKLRHFSILETSPKPMPHHLRHN